MHNTYIFDFDGTLVDSMPYWAQKVLGILDDCGVAYPADVIKIAMIRVWERLRKEGLQARLILQVHDELIVESPKEEADKVCVLLREEMEGALEAAVKLTVDVHAGATWFDVKE